MKFPASRLLPRVRRRLSLSAVIVPANNCRPCVCRMTEIPFSASRLLRVDLHHRNPHSPVNWYIKLPVGMRLHRSAFSNHSFGMRAPVIGRLRTPGSVSPVCLPAFVSPARMPSWSPARTLSCRPCRLPACPESPQPVATACRFRSAFCRFSVCLPPCGLSLLRFVRHPAACRSFGAACRSPR